MPTWAWMCGYAWRSIRPHWQSRDQQVVLTFGVKFYIVTQLGVTYPPSQGHSHWFWRSNVAVWVTPVACPCTDADLGSDVWICLEIHTTTLAKSGQSSGHPSRVMPLCPFVYNNLLKMNFPVNLLTFGFLCYNYRCPTRTNICILYMLKN